MKKRKIDKAFEKEIVKEIPKFKIFLLGDGSSKYDQNVKEYNKFLSTVNKKVRIINSSALWGNDGCYRIQIHYANIISKVVKRSDVDLAKVGGVDENKDTKKKGLPSLSSESKGTLPKEKVGGAIEFGNPEIEDDPEKKEKSR